jgi:hypothetical protein
VKVVFSTYQSAPVVAKGMKGLKPFDFAVFDEAHKTTGPQAGLFAFGLSDKNLPIAKRMFLTATPRHYDIRKRDTEGDFRLVSMDDESVYGPVAYRLSFASAVKQGIICPYKIVISVTTKAEVDAALLKHGTVLVKREANQAQWVATQLALQNAVRKTKASKVITFHSRVALAEEFASDRSSGIQQHLKGFEVLHVNGGQSAADRESLLTEFKRSDRGLIANARCLTEGVDVPAVDMVAFIDPRRSKVDIAQATGRAMRQSKATGKSTGYIVVPLFLEQKKGESEEKALKRSGFEDVAMVIAAMLEQDEDLVDVIRELRQEKGEGKPFAPRRLAEKLEVIGPSIALQELRKAVSVAVVERLGRSWDEMYGRLVSHVNSNEYRIPIHEFVSADGVRLGDWVANQRNSRESLSDDRRRRLEAIKGWSWKPHEQAWEIAFEALLGFVRSNSHARVPPDFVASNGVRLGSWVKRQRTQQSEMSEDRRQRLESISGWSWDPTNDAWDEMFLSLEKLSEREGTCHVSGSRRNKNSLNTWVESQRANRESLSEERRQRLETLRGWSWDPRDEAWEMGYRQLCEFAGENGHCHVPQRLVTADGFRLGTWVSQQRHRIEALPFDKRQRLESIRGWSWDARLDKWEVTFQQLREFSQTNGHCRVPDGVVTRLGGRLNLWIQNRRTEREAMSEDRRRRLEGLVGWSWDAKEDAWEQSFQRLKEFSDLEGHCLVPADLVTREGACVRRWVVKQRINRGVMREDRRRRLEGLKGWTWDPYAEAWENGFDHLRDYADSVGDCLVPQTWKSADGFNLGGWVGVQRSNKDAMPPERRARLESLKGWQWKVARRGQFIIKPTR